MRFVIVDGLPYLLANGKTYGVRWDDKGFTVGTEVELASVPVVTYSELSVKAQCHGRLNSIVEKPKATRKKKESAKAVTANDDDG